MIVTTSLAQVTSLVPSREAVVNVQLDPSDEFNLVSMNFRELGAQKTKGKDQATGRYIFWALFSSAVIVFVFLGLKKVKQRRSMKE